MDNNSKGLGVNKASKGNKEVGVLQDSNKVLGELVELVEPLEVKVVGVHQGNNKALGEQDNKVSKVHGGSKANKDSKEAGELEELLEVKELGVLQDPQVFKAKEVGVLLVLQASKVGVDNNKDKALGELQVKVELQDNGVLVEILALELEETLVHLLELESQVLVEMLASVESMLASNLEVVEVQEIGIINDVTFRENLSIPTFKLDKAFIMNLL